MISKRLFFTIASIFALCFWGVAQADMCTFGQTCNYTINGNSSRTIQFYNITAGSHTCSFQVTGGFPYNIDIRNIVPAYGMTVSLDNNNPHLPTGVHITSAYNGGSFIAEFDNHLGQSNKVALKCIL